MEIGLVGIGRMGGAMGERILDQGHRLTVWNRSADKARRLTERGATLAASPAAVVGRLGDRAHHPYRRRRHRGRL